MSLKKLFRFIVITLLFVMASAVSALDITCPSSITPLETVNAPIKGWEPFTSDDKHYFQNVSIYDGHPKDRATLVPRDDNKAGKAISRWEFPRDKQYKIWLRCEYINTNASYIVALPDTTTVCTVTYRMLDKKTSAGIGRIRCE